MSGNPLGKGGEKFPNCADSHDDKDSTFNSIYI